MASAFKADTRPQKVDLGVGVYKDANGEASVMRSVREAELRLARASTTKSYLPQGGDPGFVAGMSRLLFGDLQTSHIPARADDRGYRRGASGA